jgi:hypothetical protein
MTVLTQGVALAYSISPLRGLGRASSYVVARLMI